MRKIKVIQLIDSLNVGGAEVLAVNIANGLSEKNIESHLCATRVEGPLKENIHKKVQYFFLGRKRTIDLLAIFSLRKYVKKQGIQIIHAHSTSSFIAFCVKMTYPKVKIIWHNHSGAYVNLSGKKLRVLKWYSKYIDYIVSVNKELDSWSKRVLKHQKGSYVSNFAVFNNKEEKTILKGVESKRIVCLAGLRKEKDHLNLLKAFLIFRKEFPDWTLHLVGKEYNDSYSKELKYFIEKQQLKEHVFLYGVQSDIAYILSQASIGVLSSKSEGLPISLLEYGLANLPVLVTDVGECKNVVHNTNAVVQSRNSIQFAAALVAIIRDEEIKEQIKKDLNTSVLENFSKEKIIKEIIYMYNQFC